MPRVKLPDGRVVNVPDDATPEQLQAFKAKLAAEFPQNPPAETAPVNDLGDFSGSGLTPQQREAAARIGEQFVNADAEGLVGKELGKLKASVLGAGGGAFEVTNALLRRQIKNQLGVTDEQAKMLADETLGAAAKARPGAFAKGYGAGAFLSGGAAAKAFGSIPKVGQAAQFVRGQPIANTVKAALVGGVGAAAAEANKGGDAEDITEAAAVGTAAGPVLGAVTRAAGTVVNRLTQKSKQGFEALSRALKKKGRDFKPEELAAEFERKKVILGRNPTALELVGERAAQDIKDIVRGSEEATGVLVENAKRKVQNLQGELAEGITQGRPTTGAPKVRELTGERLTRRMNSGKNPIAKNTVRLDQKEVDALLGPDFASKIPPVLRRKLNEADDGVELTIREMDDMRQEFRDAIKKGESVRVFGGIMEEVTERAIQADPRYGAALGAFRRGQQAADAVKIGQGLRGAKTTEFVQEVEGLKPQQKRALRTGVRTGLADQAVESPSAAAGLAQDISQNAGLQRKLQAADPEGAQRLINRAGAEAEGLRAVDASVRGVQRPSASQETSEQVVQATEALVTLLGRGSAAFQTNVIRKGFQRAGVPPTAAKKLAEMLTDPNQTEEAIRILNQVGVEPRMVEQIARQASTTGARAAATQE